MKLTGNGKAKPMTKDAKPGAKPLHKQRSTWMGFAVVAVAITAGAIGRIDPVEASIFAVGGFAVIFLRISIADMQKLIIEASQARKGWMLALALSAGLAGCCPEKRPDPGETFGVVKRLLVKLRADYDKPATVIYSPDEELNEEIKASRVKTIDAVIGTVEAAEKAPAKGAPK